MTAESASATGRDGDVDGAVAEAATKFRRAVGAFAAAEAGSVALAVTTLGAKSNFRPRPQIGRQEFQMNALRLFALTAVVATFAAPIAAAAAPGDATSACTAPSRSIVERRI
nr:hypothetical protein [Caldimonas sp.]